jgi:hypothetical protein
MRVDTASTGVGFGYLDEMDATTSLGQKIGISIEEVDVGWSVKAW